MSLESDVLENVALIEALIFANGEPISIERLSVAANLERNEVEKAIAVIQSKFSAPENGFELVQVAGKYQFRTKPQFALYLRSLKAERPRRLTNAAMETLAIIAYRQPIVRSDIEKIRGVDVTPTLKTLIERGLIRIVGHQGGVGQPALYGTTEEFLKLFGLNSLAELPTLRDLNEVSRDPGEVEPDETIGTSPPDVRADAV